MHDDGVSSPPPDDFAEAPRVSYAEPAAGSAANRAAIARPQPDPPEPVTITTLGCSDIPRL